jgi:hypothetical protein
MFGSCSESKAPGGNELVQAHHAMRQVAMRNQPGYTQSENAGQAGPKIDETDQNREMRERSGGKAKPIKA